MFSLFTTISSCCTNNSSSRLVILQQARNCEGCLVVISGHGPQAEVAQVFGHELLVDSGEGRLEGLEEEQQNREEKEMDEETNHHTTHR